MIIYKNYFFIKMTKKEILFFAQNFLIFALFFFAIFLNMSLMPSVINSKKEKLDFVLSWFNSNSLIKVTYYLF
jgi:hypothetical protein